jgi:hypothetical protein
MSIAASDLVFYASANMPEDNTSTSGGAIDATVKVIFDSSSLANSLNDTVEVLSSNAGDTTQTVTVTGRAASGSIVSENFSLNGTTVQNGATTFERILKVTVNASHSGTITIRKATGDTTIGTMETGILGLRRLFYAASSDASGGSSRDFYEKVFLRNNHGTLSLLSAQISESADPSGKITFALANSVNDTESVANRLSAPSSVTAFNSTAKNVPGTDLAAASRIGVWLKLTLAAGDAAAVTTYTVGVTGSST